MEEYPQIKPAAEVEDMVNDFIRVDEEYLKFMNLVIAANIPKIEVKNNQEL